MRLSCVLNLVSGVHAKSTGKPYASASSKRNCGAVSSSQPHAGLLNSAAQTRIRTYPTFSMRKAKTLTTFASVVWLCWLHVDFSCTDFERGKRCTRMTVKH
eukprot:4768603-Amphidinium_carterae.1